AAAPGRTPEPRVGGARDRADQARRRRPGPLGDAAIGRDTRPPRDRGAGAGVRRRGRHARRGDRGPHPRAGRFDAAGPLGRSRTHHRLRRVHAIGHALAGLEPWAMSSRLAIALVLLATVAGCGGDSKSDKAMASVCSARDDITKQVDTLASMTITTATTSQAGAALSAIRDDLGKIADARKDLADDRRKEIDSA